MRRASENDFASAAMVRVLLQGMAKLGLRTPTIAGNRLPATVPLELKRAIVQAAVEQAGLAVLPLLGRGMRELAMEPTHLALTAGQSAGSMLMRWQRLERYIHSRHRIHVHELTSSSAVVSHVHKDQVQAPLPAEDLVVCGVLCALLEAVGLENVFASAAGVELFPQPDSQHVLACVRQGETATWQLSWNNPEGTQTLPDIPVSWENVAAPGYSPFLFVVGDRIARQLPDLLSVDAAAQQVAMTRRTFQRKLTAEGTSFQQLLSEVRFRLAGWHLLRSDIPIAEVGYVCGYSDQAHLTREFYRRVGVPPGRYRSLFTSA